MDDMSRQSFFYFTIEGDDLNPIEVREAVGLPCEVYYKGQLAMTTSSGREIVSLSTR